MAADPLLIDQLVEVIHDLIWIVSIDPSPNDRDKANAKILGMQLIAPTIPVGLRRKSGSSAILILLANSAES